METREVGTKRKMEAKEWAAATRLKMRLAQLGLEDETGAISPSLYQKRVANRSAKAKAKAKATAGGVVNRGRMPREAGESRVDTYHDSFDCAECIAMAEFGKGVELEAQVTNPAANGNTAE
jgi:hypothetical protein